MSRTAHPTGPDEHRQDGHRYLSLCILTNEPDCVPELREYCDRIRKVLRIGFIEGVPRTWTDTDGFICDTPPPTTIVIGTQVVSTGAAATISVGSATVGFHEAMEWIVAVQRELARLLPQGGVATEAAEALKDEIQSGDAQPIKLAKLHSTLVFAAAPILTGAAGNVLSELLQLAPFWPAS